MPKRLAIGSSLGLLGRIASGMIGRRTSVAAVRQAKSRRPLSSQVQKACWDTLEGRTMLSTYTVATWGSDAGPGTLAAPFRTIQEAANVAYSGDLVQIEGGTYRETVKPPHAGVTFTNYANQSVTISGTNPVTGFTNYSGSIYEANSPVNYGEGNNQILVDGQMLNEARFPNTGLDLSHPTQATVGSYSNGTIYDSALTQSAGYWTGASIHITPGPAWVSYTGTVTNSGPGWVTISVPTITDSYEAPLAGNSFYLFGKFQALDTSNEWFIDSSNHLYLWDASGDNPNNHDVEIKERVYGFDVSGVANTTIQGINFVACSILSDWNSTNTTINAINASYLTQFTNISNGWGPAGAGGIQMFGAGSVLENSTIAYSAGNGVLVLNNNIRVTNNVIHDVDYSGTDCAGVLDDGSNTEVDNNTIYNAGRDGINFQNGTNTTILSNTVHDVMLQTEDGAGIYTVSNTGGGTIEYNTVYNVAPPVNIAGEQYGANGIFLDNNSANFSVHDNVTANCDVGMGLNYTSYNEQVYNNKFGGINAAVGNNGTGTDWSGSQWYNNVFYNTTYMGSNFSQWGNTTASGSPALPAPTTTITAPVSPPAPASPPPPAAPVVPVSPPVTTLATSLFGNASVSSTLANEYDGQVSANGGVELGLKFRSDTAGYISGVRFYKGNLNTGTHTGELWSSSGTLLATATFTNESASGWQQVNFSAPVAIAANTTYIVSYHTTANYVAMVANAFTSAGYSNDQLHALQTGVDGNNSVYHYGSASAFPTLYNGMAPSYAVDVVFSATAASGAASIWSASSAPSVANVNDSQITSHGGVELGVKFRASVAGTITGVQFYKGSLNTGTHTAELWSSSGTLLATATFTNESASGWQTVLFSSPVSIAANTTYIVSYHTNSAYIAYTAGLLNNTVTVGSLSALAEGTDGNDSVYSYGSASSFPGQYNGQAGSYWVQPLFVAS